MSSLYCNGSTNLVVLSLVIPFGGQQFMTTHISSWKLEFEYNSHATADQNVSRFFSRASPASGPPNSSSLQQCGDKAPRNPLQQRKHTASAFWGCIWYFTNLEILKEGEIPTKIVFGCDSARCVTTICPTETGQNLWPIIHPSSRRHEYSSVSTSAKLGLAILASKLAKAEGTSTTLSSPRTQNESKVVAKCRLDCNRYSWWQVLYGEAGPWIKSCFDTMHGASQPNTPTILNSPTPSHWCRVWA